MIAIIGGGITGLVLAHELSRLGAEYIVLEAGAEPGGVMRSRVVDGRVLDFGPQRTRFTAAVSRLVDELGLRERLLTAPELPLYVFRDGRLRKVPFSLGAAMRTDLFTPAEKLRILGEPLTGGVRPDESVASFLTRKFGRAAYLHMLGPLYGGLYASDPADMLVSHSLGRALDQFGLRDRSILLRLARMAGRRQPPPACSFQGGMQELPLALARTHQDRVRFNTTVSAIERDGAAYRVVAGDQTWSAKQVVVTVPAWAAAPMLRGGFPRIADALARLRYNPLAVAHLDSGCDLAGFGYQVSFGERLETRGVTFNASIFGRKRLFTAYLGGAAHPAVVDWPDDRIGATAAREFELVTGRAAAPLSVHRVRMPAWDRSWTALDDLDLPPGLTLAASYESRAGIEGRIARATAMARQLTGAG